MLFRSRHTITHTGRRGGTYPTRGRRPAAEAAERDRRVPDASEEDAENLDQVLEDANDVGVNKFVLLCASLEDLEPIQSIQSQNPSQFFITAGIHPHHANEILDLNETPLIDQLLSIQPNAIGETGLDYFRNISPPEIQKDSFAMHIEIAKELQKPLYLHQRDAHDDFISILKKHNKIGRASCRERV